MDSAALVILLAYLSLAVELAFFAVPSEASVRQLLRSRGDAGADRIGRARARARGAKIVRYLLPTAFGVVLFVLPLVAVFRPALVDYLLPLRALEGAGARALGVTLVVAGRALTFTSVLELRRRAPGEAFAARGPFAWSRNPGLVGMFAFHLGNCLVFPSAVLFAGFVPYALNMHGRVLMEESHLRRRLGASYRAYAARVPRYLGPRTTAGERSEATTPGRNGASSRAEIAAWFDATYRTKGLRYLRPARSYAVFLQLLEARAGERLLDIACGPGLLLGAARARGLAATGADISRTALALARAALPGAAVVAANAEALPFAARSFDLVTCIGSLERFTDRPAALAEVLRVARPGARICFMVRNSRTLAWSVWHRALRRRNRRAHQDAGTLEEWRSLFAAQGLRVDAVHADQWPRQRLRRLLTFASRHDPLAPEPVVRPLLPLRFANEFIFLLRAASTDAAAGAEPAAQGTSPRAPAPDAGARAPAPDDRAATSTPAHERELTALYESLARFERLRARFAGGVPALRKRLRPRLCDEPGPGAEGLDRWLLAKTARTATANARVLDVGCGFGTTVITWAETRPWQFVGVATSPYQVRLARREARRRGVAARCSFLPQSVGEPLPGIFDLVVSIETLFHLADLASALARIAAATAPGGILVVVDDLAVSGQIQDDPDAQALREHWSTPRLHTSGEHAAALAAAGFALREEIDLTARVRAGSGAALARRERRLRLVRCLVPVPAVRRVAAAFQGGVALERLYRKGAMRYLVRIAERVATS